MSGNEPNPYLVQQILTASPEQLIKYVYDAAIGACARADKRRALEAVQELVNALNFEAGEVTTTFYTVYRHIMELIQEQKYDDARTELMSLRNTWTQAMNLN